MIRLRHTVVPFVFTSLFACACTPKPPADRIRVSGQVEATDVQVAAQVGGRVLTLAVVEGAAVKAGDVLATLDTADAELAITRARAERQQAEAQVRLLRAGARAEDVRQAEAQQAAAQSDVAAVEADLKSAQADVDRFEALLVSNSGSRKQRDDAVTRRDVARERLRGANDRVKAAQEGVARLRAGSRREEIDAAVARVASIDAQIATLQKAVADATIVAPATGTITGKLVEIGELLPPRAPIAVVTDLEHPWANVYVDEPSIPRLKMGQSVTLFTDAGGEGLPGAITYISPKAEFTPRNVQTAEDRSKLVYRIKVSMTNDKGILKSGMPVEAQIVFER